MLQHPQQKTTQGEGPMRVMVSAIVLVAALAGVSPDVGAAGRTDLSGEWVVELAQSSVPNGDTRYQRLTLQQSGTTLTGNARGGTISGSVQGSKVEMKMATSPPSSYEGTVKSGEISGKATTPDGELTWRAYRDTSQASAPTLHDFVPKQFHRVFSGAIAPALKIHSGDTVKTWTVDAGGTAANDVRLSAGGNPQTGPFYVEGALPGDTLKVTLVKVALNRDTAISDGIISGNALEPGYNARYKEPGTPYVVWSLDRAQGVAKLKEPTGKLKNYTIPLRPMLGCIAVAPPNGMAFRTAFQGNYGGNLDYNRIREGTIVYLPVFQPGALLFVGDGHAVQGDGELTGNALETSLDLEFRVELIRGESAGAVRAEDAEYRMAMGIAGSLNEALQNATTNMARWLEHDFELNRAEVAYVLGTAMRYDIAEVVDPEYHVVARLPKEVLSRIAR
jgi:acetamidase/formamidase